MAGAMGSGSREDKMMNTDDFSLNDISSMQSLLEEFGTDGVMQLVVLSLVDEGNLIEALKPKNAIALMLSSAEDIANNPETLGELTKHQDRQLAEGAALAAYNKDKGV